MDNTNLPCIFIPGFGQSKAEEYDENGNTIRKLWPLTVNLADTVKRITPPYIKTVISRKDNGFTQTAYNLFCDVLEPFTCDESGNRIHRVRAVCTDRPLSEYPDSTRGFLYKIAPISTLSEKIGEENIFCFSYNVFDDPFETADNLNEFISSVKAQTGAEKVNLLCYSMGGTVATAYFERYSYRREIDRVFFVSACLGGSAIQGCIMTRKVDRAQGYSLLGFATNGDTVKTFKRVLALTTWETRYKLLFRSLDAVEDTILRTSPGMWALLPPEISREQERRLLNDEKYARLRERIEKFRQAEENSRQVFACAQTDGTRFYLCAAYGRRIMELCDDDTLNTDGILDISSCAPGVKSAALGTVLDGGENLSPDGMLDVAEEEFGDTSWYLAGESHYTITKNNKVNELAALILSGDGRINVNSHPDYPRFLQNNTSEI